MVYLELWREAWGSSLVVMATSGNLSCCLREVSSPFELQGERGIDLKSLQGIAPHLALKGVSRGVS